MKQKIAYSSFVKIKSKIHICPLPEDPTRVGFEPTRAEHNGLAVHHLNYLATLSHSGIAIKSRNIKKEQNNAICSDMDGPRDCHTE